MNPDNKPGSWVGKGLDVFVTALSAALGTPEMQAGGGGERILYHYTNAPEGSFAEGLWSHSSATNVGTYTAEEAVERLGLKQPPDKVIPILDRGNFVPNKPAMVQPHSLGPGGGADFTNPRRVPASQILKALKIRIGG
jgi:hypothetical protein